MNAGASGRDIRVQRRVSVAITCWSLLPVAAACQRLSGTDLRSCATLLTVAGITLTAAGLVRLPHFTPQIVAAMLLLLIASPFVVQVGVLLWMGDAGGALRVADSPLWYVLAVVGDSLFAVPLAVFAVSLFGRLLMASRLNR